MAYIPSLPRYHGEGGPRKRWKGHIRDCYAKLAASPAVFFYVIDIQS